MERKDRLGNSVSGASPAAMARYEQALREFQCYIGDPVATIDAAIADSPAFASAHALRSWLFLLGTEPAGFAPARESYQAARAARANERERGHLEAIGLLLDGEWHAASRALEDLSISYPHDALALQAGHLVDFYTGSSRMLRDRVARVLREWSPTMPGYHAILGMHAFGLEESAMYERAEAEGRRAVELEPRDGWAQHAVAHVMEMQGRQQDGIAWMRGNAHAWSPDSFFAVHNWWHVALYHLDLDDVEAVLELYDGPIYGKRSAVVLDMIDASALLWRLLLRGVDVGDRWQPLADAWEPIAASGNYAFNDVHAMMAFVGAGREESARVVLAAQRGAIDGAGDNATFTAAVGEPLARGIQAFGRGDYAETVRLLRPIRNGASRFGGSHAQRDIVDLTLIEAALRDGQSSLARALAAERVDVKPTSASGERFLARAAQARALREAR